MVRPVTVEPLRGYRLRLRYADGSRESLIFQTRCVTVFLHRFVTKLYSATCKLVIAGRLLGQRILIFAPTQPIWKSRAKSRHALKMPEVCRFYGIRLPIRTNHE